MKKSIIYTVLASAILSTYAHAEAKFTPKQATVVATMTERPGLANPLIIRHKNNEVDAHHRL
ncbi:hypothetical protein AB6C40_24550 [Vibrio splendidus]